VTFKYPITEAEAKGSRPYQEDRHFISTMDEGFLLGVFGGHGGDEAAAFCVEELPAIFADEIGEHVSVASPVEAQRILADPEATPEQVAAAHAMEIVKPDPQHAHPPIVIRNAFAKLAGLTKDFLSGTTASVAYIPWNKAATPWSIDTVWVAVIGDSPVIVKDAAGKVNISPEHNVRTNMAERKAAEGRGGYVHGGYLYDPQDRDGPGLQMGRALGDKSLARVLSREPDIYPVAVGPSSFVLLATDGAFDPGHYNFDEAAGAVVSMLEHGLAAENVVNRALSAKTGDNVTAIVARFE